MNTGQFQKGQPRSYSRTCNRCNSQFVGGQTAKRCPACRICEVRKVGKITQRSLKARCCSATCAAKYRVAKYGVAPMLARSHSNEKRRAENISRARLGKPRPEIRGERHFAWTGSADRNERHAAMGRAEYATWRRAVYERDGFTCQDCSARGVRLNAHHVQPWKHALRLRYDVLNGVTLCESCHRARHRKAA